MHIVYRAPKSKPDDFINVMNDINNEIDMIQASGNYPQILGVGDYNMPELKWECGCLPTSNED